jgi:SufS family cysteine desulfurase
MTLATALPPFEVESARAHFPALRQQVNGRSLVYLDNAATTQKPEVVLDAIVHYYRNDNANVHRGIHELSRRATDAFEAARATMARFLGAAEPSEVIWTRGTTEGINLIASAWGNRNVGKGDEILLSEMEHHSNLVPWQMLAARTGATVRYLELDDQGELRLDLLPELLTERTRVVALNHISNALGTLNPIQEIARQVKAAGALFVVDGAQGAAHLPVDVEALGCDVYACSAHKMCGPTGIGVLWARRSLLEEMDPWQGGGEMISLVSKEGSTWAGVPHRFEAGTPNIAGAIGMAAAAEYLMGVDREGALRHEAALVEAAVAGLQSIPGVRVFGPSDPARRCSVVPFTMESAHPHDISTILDAEGVAIRAGHHCAQLVMKRYGVPATARASFYLYNTPEEVDRLIEAVHSVQAIFG